MYLVLEDNDHDPKALQELLRDHGYSVSLRNEVVPDPAARPETAEEGLPLAFLEHFVDGIIIVDVETIGVKYANQAFADMLGYSLQEVYRHKVWDWDATWSREEIERVYATRNWVGEHFETRLRCKDGRLLDVSIGHKSMTWRGTEVISCVIKDISERKKTERLLQHAKFTLDKAIDQVFWIDAQGRFYYVNEAACVSLGYTREELLAMSVMDIDPPATLGEFQDSWRYLQKQGAWTLERQHRDKSGRIYPVEVRANLLVFGGTEYYCAFATDISDRKRKERALRLNQFAMDNMADQAFWITLEGRIMYANHAACKSLGYSLEELAGMSLSDIDPDCSPEEIVDTWIRLKDEKVRRFERCHKARDGRIYPVEVRSIYTNFDGQELRFASITDISERKASEEALKRSEKRYRQLMEMLPIAVYTTDTEGRITFFNHKARELWQREPCLDTDRWCGSFELYYPDGQPMGHDSCPMAITLKTGEDCQGREIMVVNPDGSCSYALAFPELLDGDDGKADGAINLLFDITERKKAEQQLRQANLVLENSPAVLYRCKAQPGWPLEMVTRNIRCFGYTPEELLSGAVSFTELVHPEDHDRVAAEVTEYALRGDDRFQQEYRIVTREGDVRWVDDRTVVERDGRGRVTHYQGIVLDITDRKRTELVMTARMRLLQFAAAHTLDELLEASLDEAEELTGSRIGFFVFLDADQKNITMQNWSTRTKRDFCTAQGKGLHYPVSQAGVWADCIHQRQPVIHNDYASLPHCKGLPPGHSPLIRELVVPVFRGDDIVAIVAVGNKPQGYTQQDVEAVSLLADLAWTIAESKKAEEALENRLVALTRPLDDAAGVTFEELFNLSDIQRLQDDFARATGVASLIILPDGTPLTEPSSFCRFCTMIRATEKGAANCKASDAALGRPCASGPIFRQCLSGGLWGAGAAISVGGRHIASWLVGQVHGGNVTEERIRAYARKIDADEKAMVEAFREIPVMPRERFDQIAQALNTLAKQLSSIAYQNVQQARFITDYERSEEARRKSESEYRSMVENAPFGISRSNREGKLLSANPALASILKYASVQELMETVNRSSIQGVLFPVPEKRAFLAEKIFTQDDWYVFNNRLRCKDGSIVTCRVHSRRIPDKDGRFSEFESFQENITEQLAAEQALRESEEKFRVLAETSSVAICLYRIDRFIYANPAMERLFGYDTEELRRMENWDLIHPDCRELVQERALARLAGQEVPGQYEFKYLTKSGEEGYVLISAGMMAYRGCPTVVASFLDITERKRTEELIRASLEEKEVLLREIHHRVKNNLQVVSSLLYLQSQKFSDPELQTCFLESQNRVCSMALAHEQLYQSKNLADISIKTYLENLVQHQQQILISPGQRIDCRLAVEDVPLDIEKVVPCGLLITELLSNAYKHAFVDGRSGQVAISLHNGAGQFELTVADNGVGVPAGFDYRTPPTLGLQLVTALVNQLNGTLEVESGNGTCFRVHFAG